VTAAPSAPTVPITADDGTVTEAYDEVNTLSGPATQMSKAAAQREVDVARAEFIAGTGAGADLVAEDEVSQEVDISADPSTATEKSPRPQPADSGDLRQISPIRLLYRLARERAKGLLVLEGRAGILKEAYLEEGDPQFVSSNVTSERLGDFL